MSDIGRRSIAVPGEMLKRKKNHRLSGKSKGVASRTRSKTPKKGLQLILVAFEIIRCTSCNQ